MASHGTLFGDAGYGIITIREKAVTTVARFNILSGCSTWLYRHNGLLKALLRTASPQTNRAALLDA